MSDDEVDPPFERFSSCFGKIGVVAGNKGRQGLRRQTRQKSIGETRLEQLLQSILLTFYEQLLHTKIPKAQKDNGNLTEFLLFSDIRS